MGVLGIFLIFNIWNFIDVKSGYKAPIFGHRNFNILTNSMSVVDPSNKERLEGVTNQFKKGDLVKTRTNFKYEDLQPNDIITFKKDNLIYCHRIVECTERDGVKGFITQGDANAVTDGFIKFEQVNGVVYGISKGMGDFVGFITSGYFGIAVFIATACVVGGLLIIDYGTYHKFNILQDHQSDLNEDRTVFINPKEFDEAKGKDKKAYTYVSANNYYALNCENNELILTRYIRTDYKTNDKTISGVYEQKSLEETTLSSVLEQIKSSKKPMTLKKIEKTLKSKGIVLDEKMRNEVEKALTKEEVQND